MKSLNYGQWLFCLRLGLAMALAFLVTHGSDSANGIYAVLGAGLVTAPTFGEGIGVSKDRLIGTLLGVLVSIPAAWLGGPITALAAATAIIAPLGIILGGIPVTRIAVTVAAVAIVLHPTEVGDYGLFRFTNTIAGIAVALFVAVLFWPFTGRLFFAETIRSTLSASAALAKQLAEFDPNRSLLEAQKKLFGALTALPKAGSHARLDPLLYRERDTILTQNRLTAMIGIGILSVSLTQERLRLACSAEDLQAVKLLYSRIARRLDEARQWYLDQETPQRDLPREVPPDLIFSSAAPVQLAYIVEELTAVERWADELLAERSSRKAKGASLTRLERPLD